MNRRLLAVFVIFAGIGGDLLACGDKFLIASRGTRYQRAALAASRHPFSLLEPGVGSAQGDRPGRCRAQQGGLQATSVASAEEFDKALRQGGWDLVVTDSADGQAIRGRLQGADAPFLLPVAYNVPNADVAQAKKDYQRVLKGPIKNQAFIDAIDDALALREKLRAKSRSAA